MSRFQLSINVADVDLAVAFYEKLLGTAPAKHRAGYANFVVADPPMKLVVIENEGEPGTINHLGIEYPDGTGVATKTQRITDAGLDVVVDDPHTCCYATQEKAWARDPEGLPWEIYTVVDDTTHFGQNPHGDHAAAPTTPTVGASDVADALATGSAVIIDAQGETKYDAAHIPGARDFGFDDIVGQAELAIPDKDQRVILYCTDEACIGSEVMAAVLSEAGYTDVHRYPGGLADWREGGRAVADTHHA